jgi:two-component system chemotaxis response regulator CheB
MSRIVVIGGSAGSITALRVILAGLPGDFAAPVLIAVHIGSRESILPSLLQSHCALQVRHAIQGQPVVAGQVLVAPSDLHLTVATDGGPHAQLLNGPKENHCRPAIDPLFRSAAIAFGAGTTGVLLSGFLDDGTVGLQAIKAYGGIALVQDPDEAEAPDMPASALANGNADFVLRTDQIAPKLLELVGDCDGGPAGARTLMDEAREDIALESRMLDDHSSSIEGLGRIGTLAPLTCPECHGTLWEVRDDGLLRYRCHTGHAYTAQVLAALQNAGVEEALWAAVRALHEQEHLYQRLHERMRHSGASTMSSEYQAKADQAREQGQVLRELITTRAATR